jgi:hypothetical protein
MQFSLRAKEFMQKSLIDGTGYLVAMVVSYRIPLPI